MMDNKDYAELKAYHLDRLTKEDDCDAVVYELAEPKSYTETLYIACHRLGFAEEAKKLRDSLTPMVALMCDRRLDIITQDGYLEARARLTRLALENSASQREQEERMAEVRAQQTGTKEHRAWQRRVERDNR
jgi:hypothetical protein